MITQNKRLIGLLLSPLLLLLVPLIAMQYTTEVNWTVGDFLVAGVLLLGIGLAIELLLRRISQQRQRTLWIILTIVIFLLVWAELAVGIFGTPFAGS